MNRGTLLLACLSISATACAAHATLEQLRVRAAFDMNCDKDEIETVALDARTRGVRGCGRRATYVEQCGSRGMMGEDEECTWVLNTDSKRPKKQSDDE